MKSRTKGNRLIAAGVVFIVLAMGLTVYNFIQDHMSGARAGDVMSLLEIGDGGIYDPNMEMPTLEIDGARYLGRLDIPSVDLSLPIASEYDYGMLSVCPCRYTGSAYSDDLVIAGHNYRNHFGRCSGLHNGDNVVLTDIAGNVFNYVVSDIEVIDPTDIKKMTKSEWDLTLFTCTLGGQNRLTIRCSKQEIEDI